MKLLLSLLLFALSLPGFANNPRRDSSNVGEVISERLVLESSGFWGIGRFTALPKGDWRVIRKEYLQGNNSSHTGYVLKNEDKENPVVFLIVVHSTTPNYWNASFSSIPPEASAINLYGTSNSSLLTKQSFYFTNFALVDYQSNWFNKLKIKDIISAEHSKEKFSLAITRNIDKRNDIRIISLIKRSEEDLNFEANIRAWNDQLVNISQDSYYNAKESLGGRLTFLKSNYSPPAIAESSNSMAQAPTLMSSLADNKLSNVLDTSNQQIQAIASEAELKAVRLENERLRQQLHISQPLPQQQADKPISSLVTVASNPGKVRVLSEARRRALIIGNNNYQNVPKLDNAVGDAESIASLLSKFEYDVVAHKNLDEKQFKNALRQFKQQLKGGEEVVFFFAGHGVQLGSSNYLLPTDVGSDSEDQIRDEGIPLQRILDDFSESKVKFSLAVVDACRDNPFKSKGRSIGGRGLASTSAATGQMIIFSAGSGQQALDRLGKDDKAQNGLFTRVLVDKVSKSKDPIHVLMREVRSDVAKLAQTVGHEQVPAIYDQVIGDFFFTPK